MAADSDPPAFPVSVKLGAAIVGGTHTDAAVLGFSNCVVVLLTQLASIGSLVQATVSRVADGSDYDIEHAMECLSTTPDLPIDVRFLLGNGAGTAAASLYQILAMDITQRKHRQSPKDARPIILGTALDLPRAYKLPPVAEDADVADASAYAPVLSALAALAEECRVW
ncbi:hypothetical protein GGF46_001521 [Coemansia sp. RSA 552]|nr:hypothetical protein GGF46_001521 [Coemansia sp. RSA 552]